MQSVLNEILNLRNQRPIIVDYQNRNRYRLVVREDDGTRTAYCFSTPIYNVNSRKLLDLSFASKDGTIYTVGSNASITISNRVKIQNSEGMCVIDLPQKTTKKSAKEITFGNGVIYATANGIAIKAYIKETGRFSFIFEVEQPFMEMRQNDKYFALMREKFRPFVTFSCIGTLDSTDNLIAPAKMSYQKLSDTKYMLTITATSPVGSSVLFEANLYENKLFQDTTVESFNPKMNNAFGSTAFIGNTALYGVQWLYSRPDYAKISELMDKRINKAVLHMPKHNKSNVEMNAFGVVARFCSFGSNWNNKIESGNMISSTTVAGGYQSVDLTTLLIDPRTRTLKKTEGLILKPKIKNSGFSVVSTGDSYYAPQILEINYR